MKWIVTALVLFSCALMALPPSVGLPAQSANRGPTNVVVAVGGGTCNTGGAPDVEQTGVTELYRVNSDAPFVGQNWNDSSAHNLCAVSFFGSGVGDISTKVWSAKVFAVDGSDDINAGSPLATSANTITIPSLSSDWIGPFTFTGGITLSANTAYAIVLTEAGGTDASNYISVKYNTSGTLPGHGGAWFANGVGDFGVSGDCAIRLWWLTP